tara:strand:- start:14057 stop:16657 length:2601 start_codon:yes stop_codon:yes gene_type:complete
MGTAYSARQSSYTQGDTINADDSNDEFDAILAAFGTSGHSHDGTAGEGGAIAKLLSNTLTFGAGTSGTDITITFDGESNDGVLYWMEDEDYFKFSDDILINSTEKIMFGDTASFIHQSSDGVLTIDGEATIDLNASTAVLVSNDLKLNSDAAVLGFGADNDVTLTHVADTGLLLNSTMAIQFNDASQYINAPSATVLDINATDEVEVNATLMDVNANLDVSGTYTGGGLMTTGGNIVIPDGGNIGSASDTDAIAISSGGVVTFSQTPVFSSDLTLGDDLYLDSDAAVIHFGDDGDVTLTHVADTGLLLNSTMALQFNDASQYINAPSATILDINATDEIELNATLVDVNANLDVSGTYTGGGLMTTGGNIVIPDAGNIGSASDTDAIAISSGGVVTMNQIPVFSAGINVSGGTIAGTLATAAQGNVTSLGTLTTLTVDNVIINGTTIGHTSDTDLLTLTSGVLTVAGELDATTLDISGNADIDGTTNLDAVDIDGAVQIDNTVTVGVDDTGYDVKFFGDTASAYMLWDASTDDLILGGAATLGVGTTAPDGKVHIHNASAGSVTANANADELIIENSGFAGLSILTPNDQLASIVFGDPDDNDVAGINYDHGGNSMRFVTNASERLRIDSSGNVGIGTSSPDSDAKFDVNGQVLVRSTGAGVDTTPGGQYGFYIQPDSGGNVNLMSYSGGGSTKLRFYTNSGAGVAAAERMSISSAGEITMPSQPAFLAELTTNQLSITGNGTNVTIVFNSEIFDQNADYNNSSGIFTAPVTGRYRFSASVRWANDGGATRFNVFLVTSNRTFDLSVLGTGAGGAAGMTAGNSVLCDMDASDTAYIEVEATGSASDDEGVYGVGGLVSWFSGELVA